MDFDFEPYFREYEAIVKQVDDVFDKVKGLHSDCVKCKTECSDCCHALFDMTFIEALYLNHKFNQTIGGANKEAIVDVANRVDRKINKLKREAHNQLKAGKKTEEQIVIEMAAERIPCPLLNNNKLCDLYDYRPITCRLYGIPTSISGVAHTCGLSGFKEGESYPTVNLDPLYEKLYSLSAKLVLALKSKYAGMGEMLFPLSMAILTTFNETYLGVRVKEDEK